MESAIWFGSQECVRVSEEFPVEPWRKKPDVSDVKVNNRRGRREKQRQFF